MSNGILGVATSALQAAQLGLTTTSQNIANANTPGYSREVLVQAAGPAQLSGSGYIGSGVDVTSVQRVYDSFLGTQVQQAQAQSSELDTWNTQIQQINSMLSDSSAGLAPALSDFYSSVSTVANDPTSIPSRQTMVSSGQALTDRFQSLAGQLEDMANGVNTQITATVNSINGYSTQIAQLNQQIAAAQSQSQGNPANDLLDQRDQDVLALNKLVQTNVVKQSDGSYNLFIGNGQPLVIGTNASKLAAVQSPTNAANLEVAYSTSNGNTVLPESSLSGGSLGGLLKFRAQSLEPAQNGLGQVALGVATAVNNQAQMGQDLNGNLGGPMFSVPQPTVQPASTNTGDAQVSATISNVNAVTTSDYRVAVTNGNWTITRQSDGQTWTGLPQTIDGVDFGLTGSGSGKEGDSYLVQPTNAVAAGISLVSTDPTKIPAASPIRASAAGSNTGSATIGTPTVDAGLPLDPNLQQPVTITFTSPTDYAVTGTAIPAGTVGTYTSGGNISYNGWTVQVSGTPAAGDAFTVGPNTAGSGDNTNALALAKLSSANVLNNGTASATGAYSQLVSAVGAKTNELGVTSTSQDQLLAQATQAQQSSSGVNLDEEAAQLLNYQQAYQAAARVIQISSQLFTSLLSIGN